MHFAFSGRDWAFGLQVFSGWWVGSSGVFSGCWLGGLVGWLVGHFVLFLRLAPRIFTTLHCMAAYILSYLSLEWKKDVVNILSAAPNGVFFLALRVSHTYILGVLGVIDRAQLHEEEKSVVLVYRTPSFSVWFFCASPRRNLSSTCICSQA